MYFDLKSKEQIVVECEGKGSIARHTMLEYVNLTVIIIMYTAVYQLQRISKVFLMVLLLLFFIGLV